MKTGWLRSLALGLVGLVLTVVLVLLARPAQIVALVGTATLPGLAVAFAWGGAVLLARGIRLAALLSPRLSVGRASAVVAVAQFASGVLPLRLGELALPALLELSGVRGLVRGMAYTLLLRLMDLAALGVWAAAAVLVADRSAVTVAVLAGVLVAVAAAVAAAAGRLRWLVRRWRRQAGMRRKVLRQLLEVRRELRGLRGSPQRAVVVIVASVAVWGGLWGLTASLLEAMDRAWPPAAVLAAVVGAAAASSLPINAFGSFGSLEAGWTAAAVALGVPASRALADGFATHLWSLGFSLVLAVPALALLAAWRPVGAPRNPLASLTARRRNGVEP